MRVRRLRFVSHLNTLPICTRAIRIQGVPCHEAPSGCRLAHDAGPIISTAVPPEGHAAGLFGSKKKASKNKDDDDTGDLDEYDARAKVPLVGEHTQVAGGWWIQLEGAGLVVDLNGTGEDPPPSEAHHVVLED